MLNTRGSLIILAIIGLIILLFSIYRDINIEQQYSFDLRNRVVGARIQKDGSLPYFYKWKKGDGLRYYDPANFDSLKAANITASPFFHQLLYPIADLPQRSISKIWLLGEYLVLLISVCITFSLTVNRRQQIAVLAITILLLLSEAWKSHIHHGQNYLHISFSFLLFYFLLTRKNLLFATLAGLCAIAIVLIRINAIVFFLPFLPLIARYSKKYLISFMIPIILMVGWILLNKQERLLWIDYRTGIEEQIKIHQKLQPAIQQNDADPKFPVWEGISKKEIAEKFRQNPFIERSENGNVFVFTEKLLHLKSNPALLLLTSWLIILILFAYFLFINWKLKDFDPLLIAIFGFCLYMISDLFSPIWRHQYYTVQWLCPLLLAASAYRPSLKWIFLLIGVALILNILNIEGIKMEHTIGEYMILLTLLYLSLKPKPIHTL